MQNWKREGKHQEHSWGVCQKSLWLRNFPPLQLHHSLPLNPPWGLLKPLPEVGKAPRQRSLEFFTSTNRSSARTEIWKHLKHGMASEKQIGVNVLMQHFHPNSVWFDQNGISSSDTNKAEFISFSAKFTLCFGNTGMFYISSCSMILQLCPLNAGVILFYLKGSVCLARAAGITQELPKLCPTVLRNSNGKLQGWFPAWRHPPLTQSVFKSGWDFSL